MGKNLEKVAVGLQTTITQCSTKFLRRGRVEARKHTLQTCGDTPKNWGNAWGMGGISKNIKVK